MASSDYSFLIIIIHLQLYQFKYSYLILIIFKCPIDGTLTSTTTAGQRGAESNDDEGYSTFPRFPEPEPQQWMQFSVIPKIPFLGGAILPLCKGYIW